jgi:hypothetical protein
MSYISTKTFGNSTVELEVYSNNVIYFTVDGGFEYIESHPHKVAITRWLLTEFRKAQKIHDYLVCTSHEDDDMGDYRTEVYLKLGFRKEQGRLIWGTKPKKYTFPMFNK